MKYIQLTKGRKAIVDDEDFKKFNKFNWSITAGYAVRSKSLKNGGKKGLIVLHRIIVNCPKGMQVDHINNNTFDNRKSNLRICTDRQNRWNRGKQKNNTSGFKGVYWDKNAKKWGVRVNNLYIGIFINPLHAAMAYDIWAKDLHGEYANLNFKSMNINK